MSYSTGTAGQLPSESAEQFYCKALQLLRQHEVGFLVGGSHAAAQYTGRTPHTKDLDIFLPPSHVDRALDVLSCAGYGIERPFSFWIAKAFTGDHFIDLIYRAASGLWEIEEEWLERAVHTEMWGVMAPVCAVEELVWTKAALMDRNRYDGNDVLHLLQAKAHELDWDRLRHLVGDHWRLLLAHLTLFGYVYPDLIPLVPRHLLAELSLHLLSDRADTANDDEPLCRGTLISNSQYQLDVEELGYKDARLQPWGKIAPEELQPWIDAVKRGDT
ncbi:MAG: hypothetical protein WD273_03785 [Trueperaceae bacterium]